jgi:hypothetical protein
MSSEWVGAVILHVVTRGSHGDLMLTRGRFRWLPFSSVSLQDRLGQVARGRFPTKNEDLFPTCAISTMLCLILPDSSTTHPFANDVVCG